MQPLAPVGDQQRIERQFADSLQPPQPFQGAQRDFVLAAFQFAALSQERQAANPVIGQGADGVIEAFGLGIIELHPGHGAAVGDDRVLEGGDHGFPIDVVGRQGGEPAHALGPGEGDDAFDFGARQEA